MVIFLSFADVKETIFRDAGKMICYRIEQLYNQNAFLLEGNLLNDKEKNFFRNVTAKIENIVYSDIKVVRLSRRIAKYGAGSVNGGKAIHNIIFGLDLEVNTFEASQQH